MAKADEADEADKDEIEAEVKKKKSPSTAVIIASVLLASLVSGGMVGLTMYLLSDSGSEDAPAKAAQAGDETGETDEADEADAEADEVAEVQAPAQYHRLDPKFVVSFHDQRVARFMQFTVQIMTRDKNVIKQMQEHNPAVRSSLLLLFDNQPAEVMNTRAGKEQLLKDIVVDINRSLEELVGISGVEAAYFESFLIQ